MSVIGFATILIVLLLIGASALVVSSIMQFFLARKHWALGLILPVIDLIAIPVTYLVLYILIGSVRLALTLCFVWLLPMIVHLIIFALCLHSVRVRSRAEEERRKKELDQMQIQDL